jgi:hypothetical protein
LHFLFSFFKKNIQNNNYGSDVHSEKKQRKKKEGVNQQMVDNRKEQLFAKSFSLWFCELFPCCSTLFRFFSSVIGAILVILQFLSLFVTFNNDLYQVSSFFPLSFSILFFYHHLATPMNCDFG